MNSRVLFVIPNMDLGGAQRALSNIQLHFPEDWEIDTLVNTEKGGKFPLRGRVISLHLDNANCRFTWLFQIEAFVRRVKNLRSLRNQNCYKACISLIDSANFANIISTFRRKTDESKTIISVRTSLVEAAKRKYLYKFVVIPVAKILYERADIIVAVSEELKDELIDKLGIDPGRVVAITNGFDLKELERLSMENLDKDISEQIYGRKVLFTSGRLSIPKNQWHLIRAFSIVKKEIPDAMLIIAGTGDLEEYLRDLAVKMDLEDDVLLIGYERNVYRYIYNADVFVFPSGYEGFPNALAEAVCIGAPCVSTDFATGAREILAPEMMKNSSRISKVTESKYGILTPTCSGKMYSASDPIEPAEVELAKALIRMITKRDLNENYRKMSIVRREGLDIQTVVEKWVNVIER